MTVEEVLRASGMNDEQIKALDTKVLGGFTQVLSTASAAEQQAETAREAAELAQRAQQDLYDRQIAPALDTWANEKAQKEAEVAFYRAQAEAAKVGGFVPKEAPGYQATRNEQGKFAPNPVPGSPGQYFTQADGITALSNATWAITEYQRLFGEPAPDDFKTLLNESVAQHLPFTDYVSRKYKFSEKKAEMAAARTKAEHDKIRSDERALVTREFSEKFGNNPNVRTAGPSQFTSIQKAQSTGQRKDPTTMTQAERHANTQMNIMKDIAGNQAGGPVN